MGWFKDIVSKPSGLSNKVKGLTKEWDPLTSFLAGTTERSLQETAKSPILSGIATGIAGYFGGPWGAGLASSAISKERGDNWGSALANGAMSYGMASLGGGDTGTSSDPSSYGYQNSWDTGAVSDAMGAGTGSAAGGGTAASSMGTPSYGGGATVDPTVAADYYDPSLFGSDAINAAGEAANARNSPSMWTNLKDYFSGEGLSTSGKAARMQMLQGGIDTLAGLYDYQQMRKLADQQMDLYNQRMNEINGMYAEGTAENEALKKQLARQDAASGRNSQYGNRSVDLAARIADIRSKALAQQTPYLNQLYSQAGALKGGAAKGVFGGIGKMGTGYGLSRLYG